MIYALLIYLVLQLILSFIISRFIRSEADYLLAGRSLGVFLTTFSVFATWFGAETVMGSSGAIAAHGLSGGRAEPFGYTLCLLLMGLFIAKAIRARNYVTIGDFFAEQYGRFNEVLSSAIMIPTSIIWAAAQLQAFAMVLAAVSPLSMSTALMLCLIIVVCYTCLGGMLGDVINDLLQGLIVMVGLALLLGGIVMKAGGWGPALHMIEPSQLSPISPTEPFFRQLDVWMIPILGSLVAPEALSRLMAAKSEHVARKACYWGSGLYFLVGLMPILIALIGSHMITPVAEQDAFLPTLVQQTLPPWAAVVFLGSVIAAILSTIDSTLLSIAGLASHNVVLHAIRRPVSEKTKVHLARALVVLAGIASYAIATGGNSIYTLLETASSFGSAGFLVCVLGGLYFPRISPVGAAAVMFSGVGLSCVFDFVWPIPGNYLLTVLCCTLIYIAFYHFGGGRNHPAAQTVSADNGMGEAGRVASQQ